MAMSVQVEPARKKLIYLVTEDWYFLSHFRDRAIAPQQAGFSVLVAARDNGRGREIEALGFRFKPIPFRRKNLGLSGEMRTILAIRALYRTERPDIVHHVALKPIIYGSLAAGKIPAVNAPVGLGFVFTSTSRKARLLRPFVRAALRAAFARPADLAIFENRDDLADFAAGGIVNPARSRIIRGAGADIEAIRPSPEPAQGMRIVLIARMLRDKGAIELVEAAKILRREGRQFDFVLVGATDPQNPASLTEDELRAWKAEGVVDWIGYQQDIPAVLQASHIVALPSYREGLPKILLEAMAARRAILATDVPGCREAVADDVNGLLVPPRDAVALARALARLADHPELRHRLAAAGRRRVEEEFSSKLVNAQTLDVYRALAGQR
jgi:glycosyltransferase involved in cell wall biosynthesis